MLFYICDYKLINFDHLGNFLSVVLMALNENMLKIWH